MGNKVCSAADTQFYAGNFSEALSSYQRILIQVKKTKNFSKTCEILIKIGECHSELRDFDASLVSYSQCLQLQISKLGEGHIDIASTLNGLGLLHYR
jgi:hypothetical protein